MSQAQHSSAYAVEKIAHGSQGNGAVAMMSSRVSIKAPLLHQMNEILSGWDLLTDGEREACNRATD